MRQKMKLRQWFVLSILLVLSLSGCQRSSYEVWEDTKTCSRYFGKGVRSLFGGHEDGREYTYYSPWNQEAEFIPLATEEDFEDPSVTDLAPQAKDSPGDPGSPIPGIERFQYPQGKLAQLFNTIHFGTDQYEIQGEENLQILHRIAQHLNKAPSTYVFVEGHADERGAAAYNLALGARRANAIRTHLIKIGVNPDQLFTISYGKERPQIDGHGEFAWSQNRRGQFKLYER